MDASPTGDIVIGGYFNPELTIGSTVVATAGDLDAYVAKLDAKGNEVWRKTFGNSVYQTVRDVTFDSSGNILAVGDFGGTIDFGGGPVTATTTNDLFVVKLDAAGYHIWSNAWHGGGTGQLTASGRLAVAAGLDDRVYVAGAFPGSLNLGAVQTRRVRSEC